METMIESIAQRRVLLASVAVLALTVGIWGCSESGPINPAPNGEAVAELRTGGGSTEEGGSEAATSTGTGWATLSGQFLFDGQAPAAGKLSTGGKDAPTCNPDGVPDQSLLVASSGGIKNIIVYARKAGRVHDDFAATAEEPMDFDQKNCLFLSHVTAVRTSQPLHIINSDPIGHNTNISPPADTGANPLLAPGGETTYQFGRQQTMPVKVTCNIHPWMASYILPRDDPYFAISDENGNFEIAKLPAGEELEFQVWHERAGGSGGGLSAPGLTNNQGRFKVKLAADETKTLDPVKVPASAF